MNLTISVDSSLLEQARKVASRRGTSVQEILRARLDSLVGEASDEAAANELLELMRTHGGHSGGRRIRCEEAQKLDVDAPVAPRR